MLHVLVVNSNHEQCTALCSLLQKNGHGVTCATSFAAGVCAQEKVSVDVVVLNTALCDGDGVGHIPYFTALPSRPEVILLTDYAQAEEAESAIKKGCWQYLEFPGTEPALLQSLNVIEGYRRKRSPKRSSTLSCSEVRAEGIVGNSPALTTCLELVSRAASCNANVLLSGETGTGKEVFAAAIHGHSGRAQQNFVVVDCAALPESLVESTLFGHERGAFTGADKARQGLIRQAHQGTLFLDEVGELPPPLQKTFLRVLEERRFLPVGGNKEIESDFRLISATNQDLDGLVRRGEFRKDLLFRLRGFNIVLPPLRERGGDINELILFQLDRLCSIYGIGKKELSPDFLATVEHYNWPGNVRELFNVIERALAVAEDDPILFAKHLPTYIRVNLVRREFARKKKHEASGHALDPLDQELPHLSQVRENSIFAAENSYLLQLIKRCHGNARLACDMSGLSRSRLYALLKKHGLSLSD